LQPIEEFPLEYLAKNAHTVRANRLAPVRVQSLPVGMISGGSYAPFEWNPSIPFLSLRDSTLVCRGATRCTAG
jgi:hypothetical protein